MLSEIDEIAKATFSSITLATMLRLIDRHRADGGTNALRAVHRTDVPARPRARFPAGRRPRGSTGRARVRVRATLTANRSNFRTFAAYADET